MTKERLKELEKERRDKTFAHSQVNYALKVGKLKKEPCFCGETKVQAHYSDYKKPLDVIWTCKKHHSKLDEMKKNDDIFEKSGLIL